MEIIGSWLVQIKIDRKRPGSDNCFCLQIGRLNLQLATLPASLEICAGTALVEAGVGTARIVLKIGSCTATSGISAFIGGINANPVTEIASGTLENPSSPIDAASNTALTAGESVVSAGGAGIASPVSIDNNVNINNNKNTVESSIVDAFGIFAKPDNSFFYAFA